MAASWSELVSPTCKAWWLPLDDDKYARATSDTVPSSSGQPNDDHIIGYAQCCRIWPISYAGPYTRMTSCGLCKKVPDILPMDKWPIAKNLLAQRDSDAT